MMSNDNFLEKDLLNPLEALFRKHGVQGHFTKESLRDNRRVDAVFESAQGFKIYIEVKSRLSIQEIARYQEYIQKVVQEGNYFLFVAPKVSQSLVDKYSTAGLQFFSITGASKLELPGFVYIVKSLPVASKQPEGTSGTVFAGRSSLIPRIFLNSPRQTRTQAELADLAGVSRGYVSMILRKMLAVGYIVEDTGRYSLVEPDKLLDDWSKVYRFDRFIRSQMFAVSCRNYQDGLQKLSSVLSASHIRHAFMGVTGAFLRAPYMEQNLLTAYVSEIPEKLEGLYPVARGGNVVLYIPANEGFFLDAREINGFPVVSDVQLYLDLIRVPGRNEDQAEYLRENVMDWTTNAER